MLDFCSSGVYWSLNQIKDLYFTSGPIHVVTLRLWYYVERINTYVGDGVPEMSLFISKEEVF